MKIQINNIILEAETLADMEALAALALATLAKLPQVRPALASAAPTGDRERDLRDAFKTRYGKGFSMKGRQGSPLAVLEALEGAGWPDQGEALDGEGLDGPAATVKDDGAAFV